MFRFSHTALVNNGTEEGNVVAVFTSKRESTPLATAFNFKSAHKRSEMKMSLNQLDFRLATANDHDMAGILREGRTALIQRLRYEEQKMTAPPVEASSVSL